jgi:hypothetical protein
MAVQLSAAAHAAALQQGASPERFVPFGRRAVRGKGTMHTQLLREGAWEDALLAQVTDAAPSTLAAAHDSPLGCASALQRSVSTGTIKRSASSSRLLSC